MRHWKIDTEGWTPAEIKKYEESKNLVMNFGETQDFVLKVGFFKQELKILSGEIGREAGVPSVFGHNEVDSAQRELNRVYFGRDPRCSGEIRKTG